MYQWLTIGSTKIELYPILGTLGWYFLILINLLQYREKKEFLGLRLQKVQGFFADKLPRLKFLSSAMLWVILEIFLVSYVQYMIPGNLTRAFGALVGTEDANYFAVAYMAPLFLLLFCFLMRIHPLKQIDLVTVAFPVCLFFNKLGCFCGGCCKGMECSWGLYNYNGGRVEFPIQLVEAGLALGIFIFLLYWRKKAKPGTLFPIYLILYSGTRFFSEFFRQEPNVLWIFKIYHILCLVGVIVGVAEYFLVSKYGDKITAVCLYGFPKKKKAINKTVKRRKKRK